MTDSVNNTEKREKHLYQSIATYYNPITHKWQKGVFTLQESYFEFKIESIKEDTPFHLSFPLCTIASIEKRNTLLFYASLVIRIGSEVHWFASFPSRDAVYNLLELFWRNTLLSKTKYSRISDSVHAENISPLGKKLLGMLHESEDSLINTATMLDEQGEQLEEIQQNMNELNSDLTAVKQKLQSLPFSSSVCQPSTSTSTEMSEFKATPEPVKKRKYKITFTNAKELKENVNEWEKGFLVISTDLQLLDAEENLKFYIQAADVLSILVISPWELSISQQDGQGTAACYKIMTPMLSSLHKLLSQNRLFKEKIVYNDDSEDLSRMKNSLSSMSLSSDAGTTSVDCEVDIHSNEGQIMKYCNSLSNEELHQISTVLHGLQSLATEVHKERECQMDKIQRLMTDVEQTDMRIVSDKNKMKKML